MQGAWFTNLDNVVELARSLNEQGILTGASDAIDFFEKPWKWTPEWESFQAAKAASDA